MGTADEPFVQRDEVALYVEHAQQMLQVADHNLSDGFYATAINGAYYAIFYAANALLEDEYSDIYGRVMDDRHKSDYDIIESTVDPARAQTDPKDAQRFAKRVERYLKQEGWL